MLLVGDAGLVEWVWCCWLVLLGWCFWVGAAGLAMPGRCFWVGAARLVLLAPVMLVLVLLVLKMPYCSPSATCP